MSPDSESTEEFEAQFHKWPAISLAYVLPDADGRPCGEHNAAEPHRRGVTFNLRSCPYGGSRAGLPMNASPLKQIGTHWGGILSDVCALRDEYVRRYSPATFPTWLDVLRFARCASAVPAFLARRSQAPIETMPVRISAMFKVIQGMHMTPDVFWGEPRLFEAVTPAEFLAETERHHVFHNILGGRVCAGAPWQVEQLTNAVLAHRADGDGEASTLLDTIGDVQALFDYATLDLAIDWVSHIWACLATTLVQRTKLAAERGEVPEELAASFDLDRFQRAGVEIPGYVRSPISARVRMMRPVIREISEPLGCWQCLSDSSLLDESFLDPAYFPPVDDVAGEIVAIASATERVHPHARSPAVASLLSMSLAIDRAWLAVLAKYQARVDQVLGVQGGIRPLRLQSMQLQEQRAFSLELAKYLRIGVNAGPDCSLLEIGEEQLFSEDVQD